MAPKTHNPAGVHHAARQQTAARAAATTSPEPAAPAPAAPTPATPTPAVSGGLVLPLGVVTRSDISKGLREIQVIDDYFHQASIRGAAAGNPPAVSKTLDSLAQANSLNLVHAEHRTHIKEFLTKLKASAPVVHISFPAEASAPFVARILEWFRTQVHPHIVLHIGLQPDLAAGCQVRTTNKLFDFSLRKKFEQSKQKLMQSLEGLDKAVEHTAVADANATVSQEARLA